MSLMAKGKILGNPGCPNAVRPRVEFRGPA